MINTVAFRDPIAAFRVVIVGRLLDEMQPQLLVLHVTNMNPDIKISSYIDVRRNLDCFSLATVSRASLNLDPKLQSSLQPFPIPIGNGPSLTTDDVLLHPNFPGVEGERCNTPKNDRNTFLIPFQSDNAAHICIRPVSTAELLNMYIDKTTTPPGIRELVTRSNAELPLLLYGSCLWHTAACIATFIAKGLVQSYPSTLQSHILWRCLSKPLPSASVWATAYTDNKDTNYIIARLRNGAPWEEEEFRCVYKGYWQQLREKKLVFRNNRLILFACSPTSHRFLALIVVPSSICRTTFAAFHTNGVGAHMGATKL